MSNETDWVLDQLGSVAGSMVTPLRRIDREDSEILEGSIHTRTADLKTSNLVGAALVDEASEPIGTGYDHRREAVVGLRLEGLTTKRGNWGHVDPDGQEGVQWSVLKRRVRHAILAAREFPEPCVPDVDYHSLVFRNQSPQSDQWSDYYRWDVDVVFIGYETLP